MVWRENPSFFKVQLKLKDSILLKQILNPIPADIFYSGAVLLNQNVNGCVHMYSVCEPSFQYSECQLSWDNKKLRLCVIYHPPYSKLNVVTNKTFMEEFDSYIESIILSSLSLYASVATSISI